MQFDIAGRLAEGLAAVDTVQTYVSASRVRGYSHPDVTAHDGQVRQWYLTCEGLDLKALDSDCAVLRAAQAEAQDAVGLARAQTAGLADAWRGAGGTAVLGFLGRHCDTAEMVVDALRVAAVACERLRDELWHLVDRQVAATLAVYEAVQTQRAQWLAAARGVLAGGSEHDAEVVDSQVTPFVDSVIRGQWVQVMRTTADDIGSAYRVAKDDLERHGGVRFEVPGDLGPRVAIPAISSGMPAVAAVTPGAPTSVAPDAPPSVPPVPSSVSPVAPAEASVSPLLPAPAAPLLGPAPGVPAPNPLDALTSALQSPTPGGLPSMGSGGLPNLGSGLLPDLGAAAAIPGRFADAIGGLLSGSGGGPDVPDIGMPGLDGSQAGTPAGVGDEPPGGDQGEGADDIGAPDADTAATGAPGEDGDEAGCPESGVAEANTAGAQRPECACPSCVTGQGQCGDAATPEAAGPADDSNDATPEAADPATAPDAADPQPETGQSTEDPAPPTPEPPAPDVPPVTAPAEPQADTGEAKTPCEIAADELPQAGE